MMKNPIFVKNGYFIMIWLFILGVLIVALVVRIIACFRKSRQPGQEWNLSDKYAAHDFGE